MTRPAERHSKTPVLRKLRKTLQVLADTTPQSSFKEAEQFICSVCDLPIQPCRADSKAKCFHMLREGTELQALYDGDKEGRRTCLSCGKTISKSTLSKNPTAEMCAACGRKSNKIRK